MWMPVYWCCRYIPFCQNCSVIFHFIWDFLAKREDMHIVMFPGADHNQYAVNSPPVYRWRHCGRLNLTMYHENSTEHQSVVFLPDMARKKYKNMSFYFY